MIDDKDILKYLSIIEKSKSDKVDVLSANGGPQPKNDILIDPSCDIRGIERMRFGKGVVVQKDCWLNIAFDNPKSQYMIDIREGSNIGRRSTISAAHKITIGKNVLIGPNILISDHNHEYQHVGIPILHQGISTCEAQISIGDDTWIGTNVVVVGNVRIGKHCVIGSNTVVNKDVPDYCVAVGNPCRIVKIFDVVKGSWVKVTGRHDFESYMHARDGNLLDYIVPIRDLKSLQIEVSSACNLKCPQRFSHIEGHHTGLFPKKLWDDRIHPVLGQLRDIHLVGIGEPLLCKDFFYFVEDSINHNVRVHSTYNLQLLDETIAKEIIMSGLHELSFSCDGISQETYDKIRVNGTIERLRSSLDLINKSKLKYDSSFPRLILNFGGMKCNIHELPEVVKFAKTYNVDLIIAYHNVMYVSELKDESLYHYQELSDRKFAEAKNLADQLGVAMFFPGLFSNPIKKSSSDKMYCSYPLTHLYLYSDGRVGPCCMDFPDRYILGNIHEATIEAVWNSAPILKLRRELASGPSETCRYCVSHGKMDISDSRYFFRFKESEDYLDSLEGGKKS